MQVDDEPEYTALISHIHHTECSAGNGVWHPYGECTARWANPIIEGKPSEDDKRAPIPVGRYPGLPAMGRRNALVPWLVTIVGGLFVFALVVVGFYYG
jgi:hypothetical protein